MSKPPLIIVDWVDAYKDESSSEIEEILAGEHDATNWLIHTPGYLIGETAGFIHIAHELFEDGRVRGVTSIPMPLVVGRRTLH